MIALASRSSADFPEPEPFASAGWAGVGGVDFVDPDEDNDGDSQRRYVFGGAHWSQLGSGRLGVVVTMEQSVQTSNSQLLGRRLLGQTQLQF